MPRCDLAPPCRDGGDVIGGLFAKAYAKNLDRAIPLLQAEMAAAPYRS